MSHYLVFDSPGSMVGDCFEVLDQTSTLNLFVKAFDPQESSIPEEGTRTRPFRHLAKALAYAEDNTSDLKEAFINVYLLGSIPHHMSLESENYSFESTKSNRYSHHVSILIQPAF